MRDLGRSFMVSAIAAMTLAWAAAAQLAAPADPRFAVMEAQENAANAKAGPRTVPGRVIPVPDTVSPQLQASIAAPYRVPAWNADPKTAAEWKTLINELSRSTRGRCRPRALSARPLRSRAAIRSCS